MEEVKENIQDVPLTGIMKELFLNYAEETITSRALIKIQDGLKPVQRYILYAMYRMGLKHNALTRKCAKVSGTVISEYNPHGDTSAYDALVNLSQPWAKRYPLVAFSGNNGSIDGDPAAAMRYTECKLSRLGESMLEGIDQDAVDMVSNYDGTTKEPLYLPGLFCSPLFNGTAGVASAIASKMAPHYAPDVFTAINYYLDCIHDKKAPSEDKLISIIKAPDFPTGGVIINPAEAVRAYRTGHGSIKIRARYELSKAKNGHTVIVFTEIPYGVGTKKSIIEDLANKVFDDDAEKVFKDNISDIYDNSEKGKIRICVELKKNANPDLVLMNIFKHSKLEGTFSVNSTAIINGKPCENVPLIKLIAEYCKDHLNTKARVMRFSLKNFMARLELVNGFIKANSMIDDVIKTIRAAKNHDEVISALMSKYDFSQRQAQAIDAKRLGSLNAFDVSALLEEKTELDAKISHYKNVLSDKGLLIEALKKDIEAFLARGYFKDDKRRTDIEACEEIEDRDVVPDEDIVLAYTHNTMLKAMRADEYSSQKRGGIGSSLKLREGDYVESLMHMSTKDDILIITNLGRMYVLPAYKIPIVTKAALGKYLSNYVTLQDNENVVSLLPVKHEEEDHQLFFATKKGYAKRLAIDNLSVRKNGVFVIRLPEDDSIASCTLVDESSKIVSITKHGFGICIEASTISVMGRNAHGMRLQKLVDGDEIAVAAPYQEGDELFVVTSLGFGRKIDSSLLRVKNRGIKGTIFHSPSSDDDFIVTIFKVTDGDSIMIATSDDNIIKIEPDTIRKTGRRAKGVRLVKLSEGASVVSASVTIKDAEEEEPDVQQ